MLLELNVSNIFELDDKPNPKKGLSFLKCSWKETTWNGVPPLKHQRITSNEAVDKTNKLNHQLQSVFIEDNKKEIPDIGNNFQLYVNNCYININGVELNKRKKNVTLSKQYVRKLYHEN